MRRQTSTIPLSSWHGVHRVAAILTVTAPLARPRALVRDGSSRMRIAANLFPGTEAYPSGVVCSPWSSFGILAWSDQYLDYSTSGPKRSGHPALAIYER